MKFLFIILLVFLSLPHTWGADTVSIDQFKTIADADQRRKIIDQAPPEQRGELNKIDLHMRMAASVGGEAGFKAVKEISVAKARGFADLEEIFSIQTQIWDDYMAGVYDADQKSGVTHNQLVEAAKKGAADQAAMDNRLSIVHSLVFNLAPSPQAFELEKKAEKLDQYFHQNFSPYNSARKERVTKKEWFAVENQINGIYAELQALPKLTPEQAQKEYDSFPDEKVRPW
jgi:hypothetical protein